jgi:hypothetical protein
VEQAARDNVAMMNRREQNVSEGKYNNGNSLRVNDGRNSKIKLKNHFKEPSSSSSKIGLFHKVNSASFRQYTLVLSA